MGWQLATSLLQSVRCRRAIKYHNVTPPEFFSAYNPTYAAICSFGRAQLRELAAVPFDLCMADSRYNLDELAAAGVTGRQSAVVPPFHQVDQLQRLEPDAAMERRLRDGAANILSVGRLAPNKGHLLLIDAFKVFVEAYGRPARLLIVGKDYPELRMYAEDIRERISLHSLDEKVVLTGGVSQQVLRAAYDCSSMLVSTSEHEGFCVPVVEAFALGLPVVALGTSAVPGTVGTAGLVWDAADPHLFAATFEALLRDEELRRELCRRGHQRYAAKFSNARIEGAFLGAIALLDSR
jgi:glycosyltransferase involved in cell wall biosynthesis